jgi:hypothetical protein
MVRDKPLLPWFGSVVLEVTVAALVQICALGNCTRSVTVRELGKGIEAQSHLYLPGSEAAPQVPPSLATMSTNVEPAGMVSVSVTLLAVLSPSW